MAKARTNRSVFEIASNQLEGIGTLLERVDRSATERFVKMVLAAKKIFVTARGRAGLSAECFAMRLMQMGFNAHVSGEATCPKITKGDFEHYMLKEIVEQPITIQKALLGRINDEKATCDFKNLKIDEQYLKNIDKIIIIGCGTSYHAGLIGADLFEDLVKIPTTCEIASELRYKNSIITKNTLAITISQSGETADTIAAMRELKKLNVKTICICNKNNTTLTRDSDSTLFLNAGPEISVCSTKAFTSQITVLFLFSIFLARLKGMDFAKAKYLLNELKKIPQKVKQIIDQKDVLKNFAKKYHHFNNFFFIGRKFMYPTAMEASLKLKEISYINASAYPAGELKHGPLALLSENFPVLALTSNEHTFEKILSNMMEVKARNAPMIAFTCEGSKNVAKIADDVFYLPKTIDELSTLLSSVAGQLFAYYVANERGETIDQPRNLAKSVTVE